jgi:hypothetical protein
VKRAKAESRPSGALALHGMNNKLGDFTDIFREVMTGNKSGVMSTPQRKAQAMQRAQELETTLSDRRLVGLIDLFQADTTMADTYLSLTHAGIRKEWVHTHTKNSKEVKEGEDDGDDFYA